MVVGDFNDTPVSYAYTQDPQRVSMILLSIQDMVQDSRIREIIPPNRIDYILYDNALINSYFEIIKVRYSDHYPIISYFRKKS